MRKIIGLRDDFYNRHIINSNLFAPVVDAFVRNNGRYNLLDSAIIEMFEYIKVVGVYVDQCSCYVVVGTFSLGAIVFMYVALMDVYLCVYLLALSYGR